LIPGLAAIKTREIEKAKNCNANGELETTGKWRKEGKVYVGQVSEGKRQQLLH